MLTRIVMQKAADITIRAFSKRFPGLKIVVLVKTGRDRSQFSNVGHDDTLDMLRAAERYTTDVLKTFPAQRVATYKPEIETHGNGS
jgi:hypothetical protein